MSDKIFGVFLFSFLTLHQNSKLMHMKRTITLSVLVLLSLSINAQNEDKSVNLGEITIKGAKAVNKVDGLTIYPTEAQKASSSNGYYILQKLSLPNIRIDEVAHSISAIDDRGAVQLRINNIIANKQEMLAIDPKTITKIDFIDNPGVRYGEDVAYVINIYTRRIDSGYTLGVDLTPTLTSLQGEGMVYGKWNSGKSEFSLSYDFFGQKLKGNEMRETADYSLTDGSVYTIERNDIETLRKGLEHSIELTYNLADSDIYVFQASLSESMGRNPGDYSIKEIIEGNDISSAMNKEKYRFHSPILDLYFFRQITPTQSITANSVGTFISTKADEYYDEGNPYQYDVKGKTLSALSEVIYENRLKPFTLSAGLNHRYKYTRNDYKGDASALTEMTQNKIYAFGEIKGALKKFRYSLGAGGSYIHYNQDVHNYDFWTFRPKVTIAYNIISGLQLRYSFQMQDRVSRIAMISDASIRTNSMEWTVGNPDLKPSRDTEHTFRFSYNNSRLQTFADCFFRHCNKPNMAHYTRTDDNRFVYTQINQKEIDVLHTTAYASYWILPEMLQISGQGGLQRCFNFGFDYTHCYTSWFYSGSMAAYLGDFTLMGNIDNGNRFLEGEYKGYNGSHASLKAFYGYKDWQFGLIWTNPLCNKYKQNRSELINRNLHKLTNQFSKDSANQVALNVSWRISHGNKHQAKGKTINLHDSDNGIMGR